MLTSISILKCVMHLMIQNKRKYAALLWWHQLTKCESRFFFIMVPLCASYFFMKQTIKEGINNKRRVHSWRCTPWLHIQMSIHSFMEVNLMASHIDACSCWASYIKNDYKHSHHKTCSFNLNLHKALCFNNKIGPCGYLSTQHNINSFPVSFFYRKKVEVSFK